MARPEIEQLGRKWALLGIHSADVITDLGGGASRLDTVPYALARVRMFIHDDMVDADLPLPELPPSVPKTTEVYEAMLQPAIERRIAVLEAEADAKREAEANRPPVAALEAGPPAEGH